MQIAFIDEDCHGNIYKSCQDIILLVNFRHTTPTHHINKTCSNFKSGSQRGPVLFGQVWNFLNFYFWVNCPFKNLVKSKSSLYLLYSMYTWLC